MSDVGKCALISTDAHEVALTDTKPSGVQVPPLRHTRIPHHRRGILSFRCRLLGGGGNVITGRSDADTIYGDDGDDVLEGGPGVDVVNGRCHIDTCGDADTTINCETETTEEQRAA